MPALLVESLSQAAVALNAQTAAQSILSSACVDAFLQARDRAYDDATRLLLVVSFHLETASADALTAPGFEHMREYVRLLLGTATLPFDDPSRLSCQGWTLACAVHRASHSTPDDEPRCAIAKRCNPLTLSTRRTSALVERFSAPREELCALYPLDAINGSLLGPADLHWDWRFWRGALPAGR